MIVKVSRAEHAGPMKIFFIKSVLNMKKTQEQIINFKSFVNYITSNSSVDGTGFSLSNFVLELRKETLPFILSSFSLFIL